jgi:hypothetical protein
VEANANALPSMTTNTMMMKKDGGDDDGHDDNDDATDEDDTDDADLGHATAIQDPQDVHGDSYHHHQEQQPQPLRAQKPLHPPSSLALSQCFQENSTTAATTTTTTLSRLPCLHMAREVVVCDASTPFLEKPLRHDIHGPSMYNLIEERRRSSHYQETSEVMTQEVIKDETADRRQYDSVQPRQEKKQEKLPLRDIPTGVDGSRRGAAVHAVVHLNSTSSSSAAADIIDGGRSRDTMPSIVRPHTDTSHMSRRRGSLATSTSKNKMQSLGSSASDGGLDYSDKELHGRKITFESYEDLNSRPILTDIAKKERDLEREREVHTVKVLPIVSCTYT